jgi:hypothetical protein
MSMNEKMAAEEVTDRIISSIINWVCPKCGGYMFGYQCCGRCRRNWLPEWEWANKTKRNLSVQSQ